MTILSFLFGLAVFLYAMVSLEAGIREFSGQGLKNWIAERTNGPIRSTAYGVLVTAILQSSSMVSLLVLAFVSVGAIPLYNGIGVVLGANLGTTVTGWVATIIGFKMNLQALVIPLLGVGALLNLGYFKGRLLNGIGKALFAFGLLIFGLDIMKDSVSGFSEVFDLTSLSNTPAWVYLIGGMVLAAVMQSSSAVMIIALSMLNSDLLNLTDAAAVVIGADLGTTSTTVLGSLGESIVKKQLALAHVCFNVVVNSLAFFLLLPALPWLLDALSVEDPMFGLVTFHSTFNLLGLFIFLPILKQYTKWIQKMLPVQVETRVDYFEVPVEVPDAAINSLDSALKQLSGDVVNLNLRELKLATEPVSLLSLLPENIEAPKPATFEQQYESLKTFEGDFVRYASRLRQTELSAEQSKQVGCLVSSARSLVYATKTLKDIRGDLLELSQSTDQPMVRQLSDCHQQFLQTFYHAFLPLLFSSHERSYIKEQVSDLNNLNNAHRKDVSAIVAEHMALESNVIQQVSTWFNLNHELYNYVRYMLSVLPAQGLE